MGMFDKLSRRSMLAVATGMAAMVAFAKGTSHGEKSAANELGVTPPDNAADHGIQSTAMAKHGIKVTPADVIAGGAATTLAADVALGVRSGDIGRREAIAWVAGAGAAATIAAAAGHEAGKQQVNETVATPKPHAALTHSAARKTGWAGRVEAVAEETAAKGTIKL